MRRLLHKFSAWLAWKTLPDASSATTTMNGLNVIDWDGGDDVRRGS